MAESFASSSTQTGPGFRPPTAVHSHAAPRVLIHTLGCKVNQVESDDLARALGDAGCELVAGDSEADIVVVNTCTVTAASDKKARKTIRHLARESGADHVFVTGCLPAVDADGVAALGSNVVPVTDKPTLAQEILDRLGPLDVTVVPAPDRAPGGGIRTRAMVKIQDGCDRRCAYCIVPLARGTSRSIPRGDALSAVDRALSAGAAEIVLTGIDVGRYSDGETDLSALLAEVCTTDVRRVRLSSIEPQEVTQKLLETIARESKVCDHLHIPLQSGSDPVLESMGRSYSAAAFLEMIESVRSALPEVAITTDVMVGFPGERESDVDATEELCREAGFAKLHVFRFSRRPGTAAAERTDAPAAADARGRAERVRALGTELRNAYTETRIGEAAEIVVESAADASGIRWVHGTTRDYLKVRSRSETLVTGDVARVMLRKREGETVRAEALSEA